jgi:predicted helicase
VPVKRRAQDEYNEALPVTGIFPTGSNGVQTSRDHLVVDCEKDVLLDRVKQFLDPEQTDAEVRARFFGAKSVGTYPPGDTRGWKLDKARAALGNVRQWRQSIASYLYRPCDARFLLYHDSMIDWPRTDVMRHLKQPNLALCVGRAGLVKSGSWDLVFCTRQICDHNLFYRGSSLNLPLYLYPNGDLPPDLFAHDNGHVPNLSAGFVNVVTAKLGVQFMAEGCGDLRKTLGPEDVFHYAYAVFHSPTYRTRYAEFLKIDFPRLPLTGDLELFRALAARGAELVALHLLESPKLDAFLTDWPVKGDNVVEKVQYTEKDNRVWINKTQYFGGVPKAVWEFHVGGYQVCQKWLKDRKGRKLTYDDTQHYQKVVVALSETIRLMAEIDQVIDQHGGWPMR